MPNRSFAASAKTVRQTGSRPSPGRKASTIAEFVNYALANEPVPPPKPPKPPRTPGHCAGIWDTFETPEERSAYARQLAAKRKPKNMTRPYKVTTKYTPTGWTRAAIDVARAAARLEAIDLVNKLKSQGVIAPDDTEGAEATIDALTIVRSPGGKQRKAKYAKRLLRYYHAEAAAALI